MPILINKLNVSKYRFFTDTLGLRSQKDVEWTFYSNGYHYGKRCYINGQRKGNCQSTKEITLVDIFGRIRKGRLLPKGLPNVFIIAAGQEGF